MGSVALIIQIMVPVLSQYFTNTFQFQLSTTEQEQCTTAKNYYFYCWEYIIGQLQRPQLLLVLVVVTHYPDLHLGFLIVVIKGETKQGLPLGLVLGLVEGEMEGV